MAARGELFGEAPHACPFVALEDDRDARSESPDPRHRCYAEPTPQPRALAHQEAFCLSPTFAACPIFQDWAARAAARPVSPVAAASAATEQLGVFDSVDVPPPVMPTPAVPPPLPTAADEAIAATEPVAAADGLDGGEPAPVELPDDLVEPVARASQDTGSDPDEIASPYARRPSVPEDAEEDGIPPVPPFLAGRSGAEAVAAGAAGLSPSAPDMPTSPAGDFGRSVPNEPTERQVEIPPPSPRSSIPHGIPSEKVVREDVVPSWEIDGRFGAQPDAEPSEDRYGGWLTALAVVAILALGVAGVIFLPGLLAGGPARSPTPAATIGPSIAPSASTPLATPTDALPTVSATPGSTEPTAQPTADATPRLYRIRPGDSLARIARRFDLTVEEILAANPDITNPNQIQVGQFIVIPQPLPSAAP